MKRTGSNYVGLCPFHNEKTPSFTVSSTKQLFHCFGCGTGGDVITFIMKIENLSFLEAVKYLAELYGIPLEEDDDNVSNQRKLEQEKIYEINRTAAIYYYQMLSKNSKAVNYLRGRNIDITKIKMFGLGYALDSWTNMFDYLKGKGYDEADIEKSGLISKSKGNTKYYDKFRNRIIFPIIDTKNRVLGFGGRVLDDSKPKYLFSDTLVFEKGKNLYGLNLIYKHSNREKIILVEGYMDVISLFSRGINYAVASLGTSLTNYQARLLKRFGKQVYVCYDSDEAGTRATLRALNVLKQEGVDARVITLPEKYDPDDYVREYGLEGFNRLESTALNYIDYNIFILKRTHDLTTPEGKIRFTKKVANLIRDLKSPIEQDVYMDKIAMDTKVSKEAIRNEVIGKASPIIINKDKYINVKKSHTNIINPVETVIEPAQLTAEKNLILLMIRSRSNFELIKKHIEVDDFSSDNYRTLTKAIFDEYKNNPHVIDIDIKEITNKIFEKGNRIDADVAKEIADSSIESSMRI